MNRRMIALLAGWMVCTLAMTETAQAKHDDHKHDDQWKKELTQQQKYEKKQFQAHQKWERERVKGIRGRTVIYQKRYPYGNTYRRGRTVVYRNRYPYGTTYRTRTVNYGHLRADLAARQRAERAAFRRRLEAQRRLASLRHRRYR